MRLEGSSRHLRHIICIILLEELVGVDGRSTHALPIIAVHTRTRRKESVTSGGLVVVIAFVVSDGEARRVDH